MLLFIGCLSFAAAVLVGGYRNFCIYKEKKFFGADTPLIWSLLSFRIPSWLLVDATRLPPAVRLAPCLGRVRATGKEQWAGRDSCE